MFAYEPTDWRDYLAVATAALTGRGKKLQASSAARATRGRADLASVGPGKTFASVFATPDAVIVADATAQVHQILECELGLTLHDLVVREGERTTLSFERIGSTPTSS